MSRPRCPHACVLDTKTKDCRYRLESGECSLVVIDVKSRSTLEEIGAHMNLTRERVRQIEATALRKLVKRCAWGDLQRRGIDQLPTAGISVAEQIEE